MFSLIRTQKMEASPYFSLLRGVIPLGLVDHS